MDDAPDCRYGIALPPFAAGSTKTIVEQFSDDSTTDGWPLRWTLSPTAEGTFKLDGDQLVANGSDKNVGDEVMGIDVQNFIFGDVSVQTTGTTDQQSGIAVLA